MRKYISLLITVATVVFSLSACGKENIPSGGGSKEDGPLVIKLAHASTKTYLGGDDGLTPIFQENDKIRVFKKSTPEILNDYSVKIVDGTAMITISAEDAEKIKDGDVMLVYPADCGKIIYNKISRKSQAGSIIPSNQNGEFSDVNICHSDNINFDTGYAWFELKPALLRFDLTGLPEEIDVITIYSDGEINNDEDDKNLITAELAPRSENRVYYVALQTVTDKTLMIGVGEKERISEHVYLNNKIIYDVDLSGWENWDPIE